MSMTMKNLLFTTSACKDIEMRKLFFHYKLCSYQSDFFFNCKIYFCFILGGTINGGGDCTSGYTIPSLRSQGVHRVHFLGFSIQ